MSLETGKTLKDDLYRQVYKTDIEGAAKKAVSTLKKNEPLNKVAKADEMVTLKKDLYSSVNSMVGDILDDKGDMDVTNIVAGIHGENKGPSFGAGIVKDLATFDYGNAQNIGGDVGLHLTKTGVKQALKAMGPPGMIISSLWTLADMFGQKSGGYKGY